jgi:serine protease
MSPRAGCLRLTSLIVAAALTAGLASPELSAKGARAAPTLRVMLNPAAAPGGTLPDGARERLEALAGAPLRVVATTRTGALELAVGGPRDDAALKALGERLRLDRSVLWVERAASRQVVPKARVTTKAAEGRGRKLLVRLAEGADEASALPRLATQAGVALAVERRLGNVLVMGIPQATSMANLEAVAQRLQADPAVRYADPVRRAVPHRVANDTYYATQWSLAAVNAAGAWDLGTGNSNITVAVLDTGILPHPDLAGRLLPGYDFITSPDDARDGNARDADPRDEGDWNDASECGTGFAQDSFFHGLFVAGQIAANSDNGEGIAGLDWSAKILPVRVLGRCGGSFEDILAGLLWASGVPVEGAPANPHPARVINMSLGGYGSCAAAIQEAVDDALAQGSVVVVSAGNAADDATAYAPANCSGVITVGALGRSGDRASYSNFGLRIDIGAPGGDVDEDGQLLSTHAEGATIPGEFNYDYGIGTSFSAPLVSGTVSLMLARNPNLTVGQVLSILQGSAASFPVGSTCSVGGVCGAGALDAFTAIASTIPASVALPDGAVAVIEYYDRALDHYLITTDPAEIATLDSNPRWERTGGVFYGWSDPSLAPPGVAPQPMCRFYAGPQALIDSYFFTADASECDFVVANSASVWQLQSRSAFWIEVPDASGACRTGTLPVYRFFNNRRDASQRHTIDLSQRRAMVNRVWVPDGRGTNGAALCSLI